VELEHSFTVPADIDSVWQTCLDPEQVAPCMPGASISSVEGKDFSGSVKVKLGPVSLLYKGKGEYAETDEKAHRVVLKANGKDSRGSGTASATITVTLTEEGSATKGDVHTDLNITGKPAQFGRGMISDVGGKIIESFSTNLAEKLSGSAQSSTAQSAGATGSAAGAQAPTPTPSTGTAGSSSSSATASAPSSGTTAQSKPASPAGTETPRPSSTAGASASSSATPIDLFDYAGSSMLKRVGPAAGGVGALLLLILLIVRKKRS
jgi:carbon monoxide dehydrogenase subunit G